MGPSWIWWFLLLIPAVDRCHCTETVLKNVFNVVAAWCKHGSLLGKETLPSSVHGVIVPVNIFVNIYTGSLPCLQIYSLCNSWVKIWTCHTFCMVSTVSPCDKYLMHHRHPILCSVQARLSLELQWDSHVKQQRLIEERWKRAKREGKPRMLQTAPPSSSEQPLHSQSGSSACPGLATCPEREYDTWLYLLKNKNSVPEPGIGSKAHKDDKTRLEEQQTTIEDLRRLVDRLVGENDWLIGENKRLTKDNEQLRAENTRLRKEPYADADFVEKSELWVLPQAGKERKAKDISIPHLPPLEMPQEIPLEDLPALELPEDIQQELQELLDGEKLWVPVHMLAKGRRLCFWKLADEGIWWIFGLQHSGVALNGLNDSSANFFFLFSFPFSVMPI